MIRLDVFQLKVLRGVETTRFLDPRTIATRAYGGAEDAPTGQIAQVKRALIFLARNGLLQRSGAEEYRLSPDGIDAAKPMELGADSGWTKNKKWEAGLEARTAKALTPDPARPSLSLLAKLGSLVVHASEGKSATGSTFDWDAFDSLVADPEVVAWLGAMSALGLVTVPRDDRRR